MAKIEMEALGRDADMAKLKFMLAIVKAARKAAPDLTSKALDEIGQAAWQSACKNLFLDVNLMHHFAVMAVSHSRDPQLAEGRVSGTATRVEVAQDKREKLSKAVTDYLKNNTNEALLGGVEGITNFIMRRNLNQGYKRSTVLQHVKKEYASCREAQKAGK